MRKYWFAYLAKALVVFPGGFGTLDEMFEAPDARPDAQAGEEDHGRSSTAPATGRPCLNLDILVRKGAIARRTCDLFQMSTPRSRPSRSLRDRAYTNTISTEQGDSEAYR